jgi:GrpB-like predicted nucleotidyltransferase (UPF0157 family)
MTIDLNKLSTEELGKLFPIIITEYNPNWKNLFISEKKIIQKTLGTRIVFKIEHIGSTAVSGLHAKPTIDILLEIKDGTNTDFIIRNLISINYSYISRPENPPPHMMFVKGYTDKGFSGQAFHIHVRYRGDWDELVFRDYLINNPKTAQEYAKLKLKLATEYTNDREKYTDSKTEFITRITTIARNELKSKANHLNL